MTLSEVFWIAFITTGSGFLLKLAGLCYKSKCKEYHFCCIKIIRDTQAEIEMDEFNRINPPQQNPNVIETQPRNS